MLKSKNLNEWEFKYKRDNTEISAIVEVEKEVSEKIQYEYKGSYISPHFISDIYKNNIKNAPRLIYMPAEINLHASPKIDPTLRYPVKFNTIVNNEVINDMNSFIAAFINRQIYKYRDKTVDEIIEDTCKSINSIFSCLELDVKFNGLTSDDYNFPIFKNSFGNEIDINSLSSGEKQLFLRALSLKVLEVNNSVILIDGPELYLHPDWQQKIFDVYKSIGENNQIIIATHSSHVISNIKIPNLRIIKKKNSKISICKGKEFTSEIYDKRVENSLLEVMEINGLKNL